MQLFILWMYLWANLFALHLYVQSTQFKQNEVWRQIFDTICMIFWWLFIYLFSPDER